MLLKPRRVTNEDRYPWLLTRFHPRVWHYRHNSNRDKPRRSLITIISDRISETAAPGVTLCSTMFEPAYFPHFASFGAHVVEFL